MICNRLCLLLLAAWIASVPAVAQYSTPVRDVENPARSPFFGSAVVNLAAGGLGGAFNGVVGTVPAGKRLILEYVAVYCQTSPADSIIEVALWVPVNANTSSGIPLHVTKQGDASYVQKWSGGGPVKMVAEYSQVWNISFGFERSNNAAAAYCYTKVFGYTINVP